MKAYINASRYIENPNTVTVKYNMKQMKDKYGISEWKIPSEEIARTIKAFGMLGKEVTEIHLAYSHYADFDTRYYSKYPTGTIDDLYIRISRMPGKVILKFRNGKLYAKHYRLEILLPSGMRDDDNTLCLEFAIKDKEN